MAFGIEITSQDKIRIGPREYRLHRYEPPLPGGRMSSVEVAGKPASGYQDLFEIEYLKGVTANQFPKGFGISIYQPRLATKRIDSLDIRNSYGVCKLTFSLYYGYSDWTLDSNLSHFCTRLAADLLRSVPHCVTATSKPDDVCVNIHCQLDVPNTAELFDYVTRLDSTVGDLVRLREGDQLPPSADTPSLKPDEHGYKWWLRYIITPVAGSAALVTLVRWLARA